MGEEGGLGALAMGLLALACCGLPLILIGLAVSGGAAIAFPNSAYILIPIVALLAIVLVIRLKRRSRSPS